METQVKATRPAQGPRGLKGDTSLELQTLGLEPHHPGRSWHTRVPRMTLCPSSVPTVHYTGLYFNFRCTHVSDPYMYEDNHAASSVHCSEELQGIRYMASSEHQGIFQKHRIIPEEHLLQKPEIYLGVWG